MMLKPLNKDAFATIAEDLELPLVLLSSPDPRVQIAMVETIGRALLSTSLTFRDLVERVVAPRTTMPLASGWPERDDFIERNAKAAPARPIMAETALSNEDLRRLGGYRSAPSDGHNLTLILGADDPKPTE